MATTTKSLKPGVSRFSRSETYSRRKLYSKKKNTTAPAKKAVATTKTVTVGGAKNGKSRIVSTVKDPKYYPADDVPVKKVTRKVHYPPQLKSNITPGSVLILLSGRFAGKRVVFLKQLESGLLLVTGPHKVNGVPLRRVNQAYVISTSIKVDISKVNVSKYDDAYFAFEKKSIKSKATEEALFEEPKV